MFMSVLTVRSKQTAVQGVQEEAEAMLMTAMALMATAETEAMVLTLATYILSTKVPILILVQ
jgi:hypothetical protein